MYNRYIPQEASYGPIPAGPAAPLQGPDGSGGSSGSGLGRLLSGLLRGEGGQGSKIAQTLSGLLKSFGLKDLDAGDILLALIVLFLMLEDGDDLELIIALALMVFLNLGEG